MRLSFAGTLVVALTISGALIAGAPVTRAQAVAGLYANWKDLDTWTRALDSTHEQELGLGLQVDGASGTMLVAFLGRLSTMDPDKPPADVTIQVGAGQRANPNTLRSPTLIFFADTGTPHPKTLDFSATLLVDNPAAGAAPVNGVTEVPVPDFLRLASAKTLGATVLGFDVTFRPDQIKAIRALAVRLNLTPEDDAPDADTSAGAGAQ